MEEKARGATSHFFTSSSHLKGEVKKFFTALMASMLIMGSSYLSMISLNCSGEACLIAARFLSCLHLS